MFVTRSLGDLGDGSELLLIDTGFEEYAEKSIPVEELSFLSSLLTARDDYEFLQRDVSDWWQERAGAAATITLLTDDPDRICESERARLDGVADDGWVINGTFVAFKRGNAEAESEAQELVRASSLAEVQ